MAEGERSSDCTMRTITASGTVSWRSLNSLRAIAASKASSGAHSAKASNAEKREAKSGSVAAHCCGDSRPVSRTGACNVARSRSAKIASSRAGLTGALSTSSTATGNEGSRRASARPLSSAAETICACERSFQTARRCDFPEPDGPCSTAEATIQSGQESMKASAGALASDVTKSSRVRATRVSSGKGSCEGKRAPRSGHTHRLAPVERCPQPCLRIAEPGGECEQACKDRSALHQSRCIDFESLQQQHDRDIADLHRRADLAEQARRRTHRQRPHPRQTDAQHDGDVAANDQRHPSIRQRRTRRAPRGRNRQTEALPAPALPPPVSRSGNSAGCET